MPVPGAQSLDDGVMISMSKFDSRVLNDDQSVASIGPGQTWASVYTWLNSLGLAVNGGCFPLVGVGGLLLGGGMGYFSSHQGWSIDNLVGWQVVLANGQIIEVTIEENDLYSDLAWALKGGSNYFGVVTRYDLVTFSMTSAYGGVTIWNYSA